MNKRLGTLAVSLLASLALPALLLAHQPSKHGHYILVDLGTFGGPTSSFQAGAVVVNAKGIAAGSADTAIIDPNLGIPEFHAFRWDGDTLTDLGTLPGGTLSQSQAINARGVVAGVSTTGVVDPTYGPEFDATIWTRSGSIVDLGTLGGEFSITNTINDRDQAVGGATNTIPDPDDFGAAVIDLTAPTQWHAALWHNGTIRDLGTLGEGTVSFASFVNNRGQVTGVSTTDTTPTVFGIPTLHPFFWENGRGLVDVGTLGGVYSASTGLNDRGQVVGFSTLAGDETNHAFLWEHGSMQDLGTLGGDQSSATAINEETEIVGEALTLDNEAIHAFLWRRGRMTDLGTVADCQSTIARSINSRTQVVGEAFDCGTTSHAFLWEKGGPAIDLNEFVPSGSDLFLVEAVDINERGEIAGMGVLPSGDTRAFLLIPDGHPDDLADDVAGDSVIEVAPRAEISSHTPSASLAPQRLAELGARLARQHHGFQFPLPKKAD